MSQSSRPDSSLSRSSRLDLSFLWPHRRLLGWIRRCRGFPGRIRRRPFSSAASVATLTGADACAATGHPSGAPRRPDNRRSKKVLGRPLLFFCCAAPPTVDARTSTPPPRTRKRTTSTSATSTSRVYHLHGVHTGLYSSRNTRTLTTLRLRGISTCWLLSLASAPVSSFVVLPLRIQGMLEFVFPYVSVDGLAPLLGC
jgi:hypothetical protein